MATLEERKAELTKEFDALTAEQEKLNEEGKKLNQRLSEIRARQLELRGSFQTVEDLIKEGASVGELVKDVKPKK